jgi:hypothetical protein
VFENCHLNLDCPIGRWRESMGSRHTYTHLNVIVCGFALRTLSTGLALVTSTGSTDERISLKNDLSSQDVALLSLASSVAMYLLYFCCWLCARGIDYPRVGEERSPRTSESLFRDRSLCTFILRYLFSLALSRSHIYLDK